MKCLLDTHFLLWVALSSPRLADFPWLDRYEPWGVSPASFLEIEYLHEAGKLEVEIERFMAAVMEDSRFLVDDLQLVALVRQSLSLSWTRDPFDRLLAAHSSARRTPLCTTDRIIRANHAYLPVELPPV